MNKKSPLRVLLSKIRAKPRELLELFALLNLGLIQSVSSGTLSPTQAVKRFYHADNCLYVRKRLRNREADQVMSHGVQLPDLFSVLEPEEAQRQLNCELEAIRSLCLKLLSRAHAQGVKSRATA